MATPPKASQLGAIGFAIVAFACAAFAAIIVQRMLTAKGYTSERLRKIVVAAHNLPAATPLKREDLTLASWPESHLPPGAISDPAMLFANNASPEPSVAILEGEPIVAARLAGSGQGTMLAALVAPGYRAVAVKVDDAVGRSGLVYPGAHVDVIATIRDPNGKGDSSKIVVSDVRVLAVENRTDVETHRHLGDETSALGTSQQKTGTVVTVEVKPDEAEVVGLATRDGVIDLALRNGADHETVDTKGATPEQLSAFVPDLTLDVSKLPPGSKATPTAIAPNPHHIELNADAPHSSGQIETFHAR
jgi:pilus assembly protein CpaB